MRRLGIDFGVSGTVITEVTGSGSDAKVVPVLFEPNLVHLMEGGFRIQGHEVVKKGVTQSVSTARHMRHYILNNSPVAVRAGSIAATYRELGRDFLVSLIRTAVIHGEEVREVVFSLPRSAPDHYREWLASVAAESGIPEYSFIDEVAAAAWGYGIARETDPIFIVTDFGSETFEVTIAGLYQKTQEGAPSSVQVIAHALSDTGTQVVDQWIAEEVLTRCKKGWHSRVRSYPDEVLAACLHAREELATRKTAEIQIQDQDTGKITGTSLSREDLDGILRKHDLNGMLDSTITRACDSALARGFDLERIQYVLMTGAGCTIPSVRVAVVSRFGQEKIRCDSPCSVIAAGAALHRPERGDTRSLQRDYALRYWNGGTSCHEYRYIARVGTRYPTRQDTARIMISAAYDGQVYLGLAIYAFGNRNEYTKSQAIELVTDPDGRTRRIEMTEDKQATRAICVNEAAPTILAATPPGKKGDVRFELAFRIDSQGILLLDARDVMTGRMVLENHSCAKLT